MVELTTDGSVLTTVCFKQLFFKQIVDLRCEWQILQNVGRKKMTLTSSAMFVM